VKRLRVGVIGLGFMGYKHAQVYLAHPLAELCCVSDLNERKFAPLHAQAPSVTWYKDYNEMLAREKLDAVSIATPEMHHAQPVIAAANHHIHVLLEKPLAHTIADGNQIVEVCHRTGIKFLYGAILRFDSRYSLAHEVVSSGDIGKTVSITGKRILPGYLCQESTGILHPVITTTIHELDLLLWFGNSDVQQLSAISDLSSNNRLPRILFITLRLRNGVVANIETNMLGSNHKEIKELFTITGEGGTISITGESHGIVIQKGDESESPDLYHWPYVDKQPRGALYWEIDHFLKSIVYDKEPKITAVEGLKSLQLALAIKDQLTHTSLRGASNLAN